MEPIPTQAPTEQEETLSTKIPMALRKLQSNLDGKAWECTDTHRPRLRVKTTGINEEDEYMDHWDNTIPAKDKKAVEED